MADSSCGAQSLRSDWSDRLSIKLFAIQSIASKIFKVKNPEIVLTGGLRRSVRERKLPVHSKDFVM